MKRKTLFFYFVFNILNNISAFVLLNDNSKIPKLINRLKNNNDNIFVNSPDLTMYDNDFTLTVNNTLICDKEKYDSLYQTVKSCKKFISKNTVLNNTFQFISENQYISSHTFCKFNIRFTGKTIKVIMDSNYIFDDDFQILQHNINSVTINDKKTNVSRLINEYYNYNEKANSSLIGFMMFVFLNV